MRLASFAVVVVLPEPCRPTIISATGAGAFRSTGTLSAPSISTSWSCTIFTTICPGFTERMTAAPTASLRTRSMKSLTTSSATSASSSARRTSRSASPTSDSDSAPRPVILSKMPLRRSDSDLNKRPSSAKSIRGRTSLADGDLRDQAPVGDLVAEPNGISCPAASGTRGGSSTNALRRCRNSNDAAGSSAHPPPGARATGSPHCRGRDPLPRPGPTARRQLSASIHAQCISGSGHKNRVRTGRSAKISCTDASELKRSGYAAGRPSSLRRARS